MKDILDRTGIGRSTFYTHFDDKYDLLTSGISQVTLRISATDGKLDLLSLFEHVVEVRPFILPLLSHPLLGDVAQTFHRELVRAWTEYLATIGVPEARRIVAAEILAGSFWAVAKQWMIDGCEPAPAVLHTEFIEYVHDIVARASDG